MKTTTTTKLVNVAKNNGFSVASDHGFVTVKKHGATFRIEKSVDRRTLLCELADFIEAHSYTKAEDAFGALYFEI